MMHHDCLDTPTPGQAQVNASLIKRGKTKETGQAMHVAFLERNPYDQFTTEELEQVIQGTLVFCHPWFKLDDYSCSGIL